MLRSRKKLGIFGSLPPYLGGKRRLCPLIFGEVDRIVPRRRWHDLTFLDAFLGGGSVSLYAKAQGFRVIACDIAERAIVIGGALVENSRIKLTREDVLRLLAPHDSPPGRIESTMAPAVFTKEQARFLDSALRVASETGDPAKADLVRLLALRMALLCHAYAQVRKGTIHRMSTGEYESITESAVYHYVDGLRLTTPAKLWELAQQINAGVFEGRATVMKRSVLEALPEMEADVAYFDPPYPGVMSYEREYKIIDEILEGHSRPTSPFTAKDGANMIDGLFERAKHIPIWVLSLGNAVVTVEELEAKMIRFGRRVKSIALRYQHLPAVATREKKATNQEFIVVGVDEDAPLLRRVVVRNDLWVDKTLTEPLVHQHPSPPRAEAGAAEALASNAFEQGQPNLAPKPFPALDRQIPAEARPRIDPPDPVLAEGSLHDDGELGLAGHGIPGSLGTDENVKETEP